MVLRALSISDRADISVGIQAGKTDRQIWADLGRDHAVIWRERRRNTTKARGYRPVSAVCADIRRHGRSRQIQSWLRESGLIWLGLGRRVRLPVVCVWKPQTPVLRP